MSHLPLPRIVVLQAFLLVALLGCTGAMGQTETDVTQAPEEPCTFASIGLEGNNQKTAIASGESLTLAKDQWCLSYDDVVRADFFDKELQCYRGKWYDGEHLSGSGTELLQSVCGKRCQALDLCDATKRNPGSACSIDCSVTFRGQVYRVTGLSGTAATQKANVVCSMNGTWQLENREEALPQNTVAPCEEIRCHLPENSHFEGDTYRAAASWKVTYKTDLHANRNLRDGELVYLYEEGLKDRRLREIHVECKMVNNGSLVADWYSTTRNNIVRSERITCPGGVPVGGNKSFSCADENQRVVGTNQNLIDVACEVKNDDSLTAHFPPDKYQCEDLTCEVEIDPSSSNMNFKTDSSVTLSLNLNESTTVKCSSGWSFSEGDDVVEHNITCNKKVVQGELHLAETEFDLDSFNCNKGRSCEVPSVTIGNEDGFARPAGSPNTTFGASVTYTCSGKYYYFGGNDTSTRNNTKVTRCEAEGDLMKWKPALTTDIAEGFGTCKLDHHSPSDRASAVYSWVVLLAALVVVA